MVTEGDARTTSPIRLIIRGVSGTASADGGCDAVCRVCGRRWWTKDLRAFTAAALGHVCGDDPAVSLLREVVAAVGVESLPAGLVERLRSAGVVKE